MPQGIGGNGLMVPRAAEWVLRHSLRKVSYRKLGLEEADRQGLPPPAGGRNYTLYVHIPFCEVLCPYCSFNRYPYTEALARPYFESLREEMQAVARLGYQFGSLYIGGGTPTILTDELARTIDLAKALFGAVEVSTETNPNHLTRENLALLAGRVDRLSVGVQSFDDGLLKAMSRHDKYGSSERIMERLQAFAGFLPVLNVDMIFNFPGQTEAMVLRDLERIGASGANQATFYPLMVSPSVEQALLRSMGRVDYRNEARFFKLINERMPEGFRASSAWSFDAGPKNLIDEYIVDCDGYVGIGSGAFSYLDGVVYSNTFSLAQYGRLVAQHQSGLSNRMVMGGHDRHRYHFMMRLFSTRLNKREFAQTFGVGLERALWREMAFLRLAGAFSRDDDTWLELSQNGRYLLVVLMREFFIGVNRIRDEARRALSPFERALHCCGVEGGSPNPAACLSNV